jgi:type I restriction enzyme, S subunit
MIGRSFFSHTSVSAFFKRALLRSSSQTAQAHLTITLVRELPILRSTPTLRRSVAQVVERALAAKAEARKHSLKAEERLALALGLAGWAPPEPLAYVRTLSNLKNAGRWDSQFYLPHVDAYLEHLSARMELWAIGSLGDVTNGEPVQYSDEGTVPIVRSGDLVDLDDDDRFLRAAQGQSVFVLEKGDVLISSIGFGSIGKVQVFDKPGTYGTVSEVTVIRQKKLDPYFLAAFLRSKPGQVQIERWITGATGQLHLYPRDVKRIMVPLGDTGLQQSMRQAAEDARRTRRKAGELLEAAKRAVEMAIEQNEAAALRFLDGAGR